MDHTANLLNGILNAGRAGHTTVVVPKNKLSKTIVHKLLELGYVAEHTDTKDDRGHATLTITLAYNDAGKHKITGIKRLSKLSRRVYGAAKNMYKVKHGHGHLIVSTPKGILDGYEARKQLVGGELLFEIW